MFHAVTYTGDEKYMRVNFTFISFSAYNIHADKSRFQMSFKPEHFAYSR